MQYLKCPFCGKETNMLIAEDTILINALLSCSHCGKQVKISINNNAQTLKEQEKIQQLINSIFEEDI